MPNVGRRLRARFVALVRADPQGFRAGFVALLIGTITGLVAGLTLGSITGTLEKLPGLLLLVPAAIGMRGSIFGALGSRLGTAIHTGTFQVNRRVDSLVGQNAAASFALTLVTSAALAVLAKAAAVTFGVGPSISIADFLVVSMIGGILASLVVLVVTIAVASLSVRREWDLDNVAVPIVTNVGDVVSLPALVVGTWVVGIDVVTPLVATLGALAAAGALVMAWRAGLPILRAIVRESLPVLLLAGVVDLFAGATVEHQIADLVAFPVLLAVVPPFLSQSGALGGILASRVGTKLHLGVLTPRRFSLRPIDEDIAIVAVYAVPVYVLLAVVADVAGRLAGFESPGLADVVGVVVLAGVLTMTLVVVVAYASSVAAQRLGLDPDNYGIPLVTSLLDLAGAFALVLAISVLGVT